MTINKMDVAKMLAEIGAHDEDILKLAIDNAMEMGKSLHDGQPVAAVALGFMIAISAMVDATIKLQELDMDKIETDIKRVQLDIIDSMLELDDKPKISLETDTH